MGRLKCKYELKVDAGSYQSDTLYGLIKAVISHRWWHWKRGDGWVD